MATVGAGNLTLVDLLKRTDPNGAPSRLVELLSQQNAILMDAVWKEGNLPTGERVSSRTGLPSIGWRRFNEGVTAGKSRTDQWDETCGQLEGLSVVDCELARLNGNEAAYRASEDTGFVQALSNEVESRMFYASTKIQPETFMGLAPRFDATTNPGGTQIIKHDAAGVGQSTNTSIWLVKWSEDATYCIYPKGMSGGIQPHDMGQQLWDDGTGKKFRAYVTNWTWKVGLVVKDWRQIVRIADVYLTNLSTTGTALIQSMVRATHLIQNPNGGRLCFYVNRLVGTYLHLQALSGASYQLTVDTIGGHPVLQLAGIPIRITDALLNTEAGVA